MTQPLVSIITPSYNQVKYIRATIESVLAQTYSNIEYIVVDGGSTDGSLEIIQEYTGKLRYISEKDAGQSDAINKGFRMAQGEIVAWLNSDDVYEPDCIETAVAEFEKDEQLGLIYGDGYIINEKDEKLKVFQFTQKFEQWDLINVWDYIMQPTTFFRKSCLERVDYLDVNLHYCMDWKLWIELSKISKVKYIEKILACSREYEDTKTSTGGEKRLQEIMKLMQHYSGRKHPIGYWFYYSDMQYNIHKDTQIQRYVYALNAKCIYAGLMIIKQIHKVIKRKK